MTFLKNAKIWVGQKLSPYHDLVDEGYETKSTEKNDYSSIQSDDQFEYKSTVFRKIKLPNGEIVTHVNREFIQRVNKRYQERARARA